MKKYILLLLISLFFPLNCISSPKVYNLYSGEVRTFNVSYKDKFYYFLVETSKAKAILINLTTTSNYSSTPFQVDKQYYYDSRPEDSSIINDNINWIKDIDTSERFKRLYKYYISISWTQIYLGIRLSIKDSNIHTFGICAKKVTEKEGKHFNGFVMFLLAIAAVVVLSGIIWFFTKTEVGSCILACCCLTFCSSEGGGD